MLMHSYSTDVLNLNISELSSDVDREYNRKIYGAILFSTEKHIFLRNL